MLSSRTRHEWRCPSDRIDILEAIHLANYFNQKFLVISLSSSHNSLSDIEIHINLRDVKFCTLYGVLSLASIVSRLICHGVNIALEPPSDIKANGFLKYFGFITLLDRARDANALDVIAALNGTEPLYGKRVFHTKPIYKLDDAVQFYDSANLRAWLNQLPSDIRDSELFNHGRFARVITSEMSENIATHAKLPMIDIEGRESFGVVGMRVIQQPDTSKAGWVYKSFNSEFRSFVSKHIKEGFAELCICDSGDGIYETLKKVYELYRSGGKDHEADSIAEIGEFQHKVNVIQFAFDELGSSKSFGQQWLTEAHALSRILGLVKIYGGILELFSSGVRLAYILDNHLLIQSETGLGYKATKTEIAESHWGSYFRILIPLTKSRYIQEFTEQNTGQERSEYAYDFGSPYIVSISNEFDSSLLNDPEQFRKRTNLISKLINKQNKIRPILIDFSEASQWKTDHIGTLLELLTNLIRTRLTVIVGLSSDVAVELEERVLNSVQHFQESIHAESYSSSSTFEVLHRPLPKYYLSCLVDFHRVIIAIDIEGAIYWVGAPNIAVKAALNSMLDEPGNLSEICRRSQAYQKYDCSPPEETTLTDIVRSSQNLLFEHYAIKLESQYFGWKLVIDRVTLDNLRAKALSFNFLRHLRSKSKAIWGEHKVLQAFLLPHSGKWAKTYIECSKLLQDDRFSREVGEVCARMLWIALEENDPDVLLCSTASSILLANSMRPWFSNSPLIIDVGHYFDVAKRKAIRSLNNVANVVIVQDIVDTGKTVNDLVDQVDNAKLKVGVSAVVCLIEFQENLNAGLAPGFIGKRVFGTHKREVPYVCLQRWKRPDVLQQDELDLHKYERYWVEPYSLHPFKIKELENVRHEYLLNNGSLASSDHIETLRSLESNDAIATGHFVFENHHFSLVTRMRNLFERSILADKIVDEIVAACDGNSGQLIIILPLHSNIKYLSNKILDKLSTKSITPLSLYAIAVKELGQRPFYMIPYKLDDIFEEHFNKIKKGETAKLFNVLIIDDTIASSRTIETLMRALYLCEGNAFKRVFKRSGEINYVGRHPRRCINKVDVWAVINRMERSKSTLFYTLNKWLDRPFRFHCFAEYDISVYDLYQCPICDEYRYYEEIKTLLVRWKFGKLTEWLKRRESELEPIIVDTPQFDKYVTNKYPAKIQYRINEHECRTTELSILAFMEISERGCPTGHLIETVKIFSDEVYNESYLNDQSVIKFKAFVIRWFLNNWKRVASDLRVRALLLMLKKETTHYLAALAPDIIDAACRGYRSGRIPRRALLIILKFTFKHLGKVSKECQVNPSINNMMIRENIFTGAVLSAAHILLHEKNSGDNYDEFYKLSSELPHESLLVGDFLGSIRDTLRSMLSFMNPEGPSYLDCLKVASMEIAVTVHPLQGTRHNNRLIKHLREINNLDVNITDIISAPSFQTSSFVKIIRSVDFLETKAKMFCFAIEKIINDDKKYDQLAISKIIDPLKTRFERLIANLKTLNNKVNIQQFDNLDRLWAEIKEDAGYIEDKIISGEIADKIKENNVDWWAATQTLIKIAKDVGLEDRLSIAVDEKDKCNIFVDKHEFSNLLKNRTIDVLQAHPELRITLHVMTSPLLKGEDQKVIFEVITMNDITQMSYENIMQGHGYRLEKWGLVKFGGEIINVEKISKTEDTSEGAKITYELVRGY